MTQVGYEQHQRAQPNPSHVKAAAAASSADEPIVYMEQPQGSSYGPYKKAAKEGKGAAQLDGRMIDAASARMAENVVDIDKLINKK